LWQLHVSSVPAGVVFIVVSTPVLALPAPCSPFVLSRPTSVRCLSTAATTTRTPPQKCQKLPPRGTMTILYSTRPCSRQDEFFLYQLDYNYEIPSPCSPIWEKWNGSSGQTPCPCHTEDPLLLVPLVLLRSEDPLLLVPRVPRTTCPNLVCPIWLYHLSFSNSLF